MFNINNKYKTIYLACNKYVVNKKKEKIYKYLYYILECKTNNNYSLSINRDYY